MAHDHIIQKTHEYLKERLQAEGSGHDYWHMFRVWRMAKHIAAKEQGADMFVVELAALLHDIADYKFVDEEKGRAEARRLLTELEVEPAAAKHVLHIIANIGYKGGFGGNNLNTIEGQIVSDADRLDALGAVGISRVFAYGGSKGRTIHDPNVPPIAYTSRDSYKNNKSSSINHFYEKLLLLKDTMFTKTGKKIVQHRHAVMEQFLQEFLAEWEVKR